MPTTYSPPASNAVNFNDTGSAYTAPIYNVVYFSDFDIDGIHPDGVASGEAFGVPSLVVQISPSGVVTAELFGSPSVVAVINPNGIAGAEAFGTPTVTFIAIAGRGIFRMHVENGITLLTTVFW